MLCMIFSCYRRSQPINYQKNKMGHQIKEHDTVLATEKTWHGLEGDLVQLITRETCNANFVVEHKPVFTNAPLRQGAIVADVLKANTHSALVNVDDERIIWIARSNYPIIQNSAMWDMAEKILSVVPGKVTCSGTLDNQRRAFLSMELDQEWTPMDEVWNQHVNICNSFDGSTAFELYDSATRVVCDNTLQFSRMQSMHGEGMTTKALHMGDVDSALRTMEAFLGIAFASRKQFEQLLARTGEAEIDGETCAKLTAAWLARTTEQKILTSRAATTAKGVLQLFYGGKGCNGRTMYDLFNAGTQWFTTGDGAGKKATPTKRANSEFGIAANRKVAWADMIMSAVQSDEFLDQLADEGEAKLEEVELTTSKLLSAT